MTARVLLAGLHLLDRQLVDRDGRLAGKVDDVELTLDDRTGDLRVTALLSGHGSLLRRFGSRRLADWMEDRQQAEHGEHSRIPIDRVAEIGSAIRLGVAHEELATFDTERWVRDHVTSHIPGSRHEDAS
jgi:sporulation protein YlmC with PRC-barrel domain